MKIKFYTLLYIAPEEKRQLGGRVFSDERRIDVFVHNACVLNRTLQIACGDQGVDGCCILTNDEAAINRSLQRIGDKMGGKNDPVYPSGA